MTRDQTTFSCEARASDLQPCPAPLAGAVAQAYCRKQARSRRRLASVVLSGSRQSNRRLNIPVYARQGIPRFRR